MSGHRKLFIHKQTYYVTFRAEEGIPMPANPLMNEILKSILCAAQSKYRVEICAFVFMGNHVHLVIVVTSPSMVHCFVQYLKRESAHAVNRLLGRRKRKIWCDGYDSPIILDPENVIKKIVYTYTNPQASGLEDTIDKYPGFSSWEMFISGNLQLRKKRIKRSSLIQLRNKKMTFFDYQKIILQLEDSRQEENTLVLTPFSWLESFETELTEEEVRESIIQEVREEEESLRKSRKVAVIGADRLARQSIDISYSPKKFGKKMICLSGIRELRVQYINWYKTICAKAAEIHEKVKKSLDTYFSLPPGMFAPGGFLYANVLP